MVLKDAYIGQRVRVPLGLDEVGGVILDIFGPPRHRFARVALAGFDPETGEPAITVPLSELKSAPEAVAY
jgi:hypothetical protein